MTATRLPQRRPSRGDIWAARLDPVRGHEQGGIRPCLVVSTNPFNHGPSGLVLLVPITTRDRGIRLHVPIDPPEGGLTRSSFILCEQVRASAYERLTRRLGRALPETMEAVESRVRWLMEL